MMTHWISAMRLRTLPAGVSPVLIGLALAHYNGFFNPILAVLTLFGAIFIQVGTNFANDYFDFKKGADTADRLGPVRATQAGLIRPVVMKRAFYLSFFLAFLCGAYLSLSAGWEIALLALISIVCGVVYTGGPFPLAYNGLGDIFVLIFFGPVAVAGTYYVQSLVVTPSVVFLGLAPGFLSVAILAINNLRDINTDRKADKMTLAARFGERFARREYLMSILLAAFIPVFHYSIFGEYYWTKITVLILLPAIRLIRHAYWQEGVTLNIVLSRTGQLLVFYTILFIAGLYYG